jgi:hypothetical protein
MGDKAWRSTGRFCQDQLLVGCERTRTSILGISRSLIRKAFRLFRQDYLAYFAKSAHRIGKRYTFSQHLLTVAPRLSFPPSPPSSLDGRESPASAGRMGGGFRHSGNCESSSRLALLHRSSSPIRCNSRQKDISSHVHRNASWRTLGAHPSIRGLFKPPNAVSPAPHLTPTSCPSLLPLL